MTQNQQKTRPDSPSEQFSDARGRHVLQLLQSLLPAERSFDVRLWNGDLLAATLSARATLVLNDPDVLARMLQPPLDLAAGEAYLRGDFDIEGDISAIMDAVDDLTVRRSPADWLQLARQLSAQAGSPLKALAAAARMTGRKHSRQRDRQAIEHHYDVSNDFYKLWLDEQLIYSCAYFETGKETLQQAQTAKLDLICRKLQLQPDEHLLDIGCGWGGLLIHAAQNFGVTGVGVTLSSQQVVEAQRRIKVAGLQDRIRVELLDYRDLTETFDKIVSVGMAEHVGAEKLPAYFQLAWTHLNPRGLMLNHAISRGPVKQHGNEGLVTGEFVQRYVFPDGEILPLWQQLQAAESAAFEVRDVEDLREHYARTLSCWVTNLESRWADALAQVTESQVRLWKLYMSISGYYFQRGYLSIHQTLLAKPDKHGFVNLPTRHHWLSVSRQDHLD